MINADAARTNFFTSSVVFGALSYSTANNSGAIIQVDTTLETITGQITLTYHQMPIMFYTDDGTGDITAQVTATITSRETPLPETIF